METIQINMEKQFKLIEAVYASIEESRVLIQSIRQTQINELKKVKKEVVSLYDHSKDTLYLVCFDTYNVRFHKATKERLVTVSMDWFKAKTRPIKPKTFEEAVKYLEEYKDPSNGEISSYREFGYFHDIEGQWTREDWISESVMERDFLYDVTESDFMKAINNVVNIHNPTKK